MTPDTLGEIYEYQPTWVEWFVSAGIFGIGFLIFTVLVKIAVPIMGGEFQRREQDLPGQGRRQGGQLSPLEGASLGLPTSSAPGAGAVGVESP
jgi:hypothetical protein